MKSRIVAIAAGIVAMLLLTAAIAPGALAQTPGPGNGQGTGQGNQGNTGNTTGTPGTMQGRMGNMAGAGMGMGMMGGQQSSLITVAASQLNMSVQDLVTALGGTKSIAQVATEHNVQVSTIIDAFLAPRAQQLANLVRSGRITQAQADQMLASMRTNVTEEVNKVWTAKGTGNGTGNGTGYGQGNGTGYVDSDGDGVCDNMPSGAQPGNSNGRMGRGGPNR